MKCPTCGNTNHSEIRMTTYTTWGQGEAFWNTQIECTHCGFTTKHIYGYGLFPENQEWREIQKEFLK